jgi:D-sedoheptulose 7-phosphate isomerase
VDKYLKKIGVYVIMVSFAEHLEAHRNAMEGVVEEEVMALARLIVETFKNGNKVLVCGNGGSAADAQHFAAELVAKFRKKERKALPVLALHTNTSTLTAWANDVGYEEVFARQVEAFGKPGDLLLAISTSGNSKNVVKAVEVAKNIGIKTVLLGGRDGGVLKDLVDHSVIVKAHDTPRIQEAHIFILHFVCDYVEEEYAPQ